MKLEVGMYVRTKNGYIRKIDRIWDDTHFNVDKVYYNNNIYEDTLGCILDEDIKGNPSYNIIDLIEEGDYVNGYYVTTASVKGCCSLGSIYIAEIDGLGLKKKLYEKDIKSIVTKEQFESMSYKAGE